MTHRNTSHTDTTTLCSTTGSDATLTHPVSLDDIFPPTRPHGLYQDARGFTYRSVRFCDLDRICDK